MFIHNKSFFRQPCHMIWLNHWVSLKKFSKVFRRKCWVVENNDFLENCPVRLNPTRYSSMGHWIALWFHLLVVVAVLHLRVPTQAMHPNISSKDPICVEILLISNVGPSIIQSPCSGGLVWWCAILLTTMWDVARAAGIIAVYLVFTNPQNFITLNDHSKTFVGLLLFKL